MRGTEPDVGAAPSHATRIPVLGIVTRFVSNSERVLDVVEDAFGDWRSLDVSLIDQRPTQTVRVIVHPPAARADAAREGAGASDPHPADDGAHRASANSGSGRVAHLTMDDGRLLIHARDAVGVSDPQLGEAMAWVATAMPGEARFRHEVLEALTWALLTRCDRQPLHAAALVRDGAGLLLCGSSGSGKSTLAYAAARAGIRVLSEDIVFVQTQPSLRVWSMPGALHLLPGAAACFEELADAMPTRVHTGKHKVVIDTSAIGAAAAERAVERCGVCVLGERRNVPQCRRLTRDEAVTLLDLSADAGFDSFADTLAPVVRRLAGNGAWLLHPSHSPHASVPLLSRMLTEVSAVQQQTAGRS